MKGRPSFKLFTGNKLFVKMLLYFFSLLIPIAVIGLIVYINERQQVQEDISRKLSENLASSMHTVDIYLGMVQATNNNLIFSHTIQQNLKPYNTLTDEDRINLTLIVKEIWENKNTLSPFIDNIFVYADTDRVYTSQEMVDFDYFFGTFYKLDSYNKVYWEQKLNGRSSFFDLLPPSKIYSYDRSAARDVIPSVTTQYVNGQLAAMVTCLSVSAISSSLKSNSLFPSTSYMILDSNRNTVLDTNGVGSQFIEKISGLGRGQALDISLNPNEHALVARQTSEAFGWDYYSITPLDVVSNDPQGIISLTVWICIALFVIGIAFSFMFSINLYNPIKNIRDILLSGDQGGPVHDEHRKGDEWNMIGSRVNRLIEQHEVSLRKLNQYSSALADQFFTSLFRGTPWTQQHRVSEILSEIEFQAEYYMCCCFLFRFNDKFYREIAEPDRLLIQEKMKNVLWGIMKQHVNCYLMEYETDFYVCVVSLEKDNDRDNLDRGIDSIRNTFDYDMVFCELAIGIGKTYSKVGDISKSYSDALTALDMRGDRHVLPVMDAAELDIQQTFYYSFMDENKVVNGLKVGSTDALRTEVERIIQTNKNNGVSFTHLGALLAEFVNTGVRFLQEKQLSVQNVMDDDEYALLADKNIPPSEFNERVEMLLRFYETIISETATKEEKRSGTVVSLITQFIETHYHEDIYLESIAGEIGLSAKYISRMFKETTGTSITDYISMIRIAKAKELLLGTDLKISDIADQIGINNRTTFLRLFKKYEGVSPIHYRNARDKQEQGPADQQ
ncbi:helix-turn-helix domain-containing protein [Paenibacillus thalictri]|nr:helix-turn-helix domain-containing protein [Paenibacillus thalictri]